MWTNKFLFGIVFMLLSVNISYSQSGWVWQNPTPFGSVAYFGCDFINENTGWVLGGKFLAKTTTGGTTWERTFESNSFKIYCMDFINPNIGFIGGPLGKFFKTNNGGISWDTLYTPDSLTVGDFIYFKNESTGFLASRSKLLRTSNGGSNWSKYLFPESEYIRHINMVNENECILFSTSGLYTPKIYKSTNGGVSWMQTANIFNSNLYDAFFINLNTGWAYGNSEIRKTTNSGINWVTQVNDNSLFFNSIRFTDDQNGFACDRNGKIFKTNNGGTNWQQQVSGVTKQLVYMSVPSASTAYISGDASTLLKTSNAGGNWYNLINSLSDIFIFDVQALNSSLIFGTGWFNFNEPYICKSTNGGSTWEFLPTVVEYTEKIFFVNSSTGWVGGLGGFAKTTNGGINWQRQTEISSASAMQFLNAQTGWVIRSNLSKTTNGGTNWTNITFGNSLVDLKFFNDLTGFAISYNGVLYKSSNAGNNWNTVSSNNFTVKSCEFIDESNAVAASNNRKIFRTTNSGINWQSIDMAFNVDELKFLNLNTGWAVGEEFVAATTNGGVNWNIQASNCFGGNKMYSCDFINENTGWITGGYGSILKTTTGGNVFISQISTEIPEKYSLYQNYPNPFNPSTNIKFDIHKQGIATLKVFDLLGKEMETLVDEQLSVGTYDVTFNASSLPSGIYFYVLKTGDFVESKKMILVK